MARDDAQVNFRIPHELNERLKAAAAGNNRSVTAELVNRLQRSLDEDQARAAQPLPEEVAAMLGTDDGIAKALAEMGALARRLEELAAPLKLAVAESAALVPVPKRRAKNSR